MNENGKERPSEAGKAFVGAVADDPQTKQSLARAMLRLRLCAEGLKAVGAPHREVMETVGRISAAVHDALKKVADEHQRWIETELAALRAKQEQAFSDLTNEIEELREQMDAELVAHGFDPPEEDLAAWENLARIVEKDPSPMTMAEIHDWAIAWAKREIIRCKIARGETPIQAGQRPTPKTTRTAANASIRRDEHDPRIAWCLGKRIYLGNDTHVSRLFWLLASPVGRACTLAEVQRVIDGFETDRENADDFKQAMQRVRKAFSRLRRALRENNADDHLLIVRGGDDATPDYTMVLRFGGKD